jgi:Zn-dependent peptidase ImmA (M78 family)
MPPARPAARVERAAERLLEAHGISKAPVDVRRLATLTGITVAFDDLGSNDVSGMLYRRSPAPVMVINMHHSSHRQRFTIAHEIGHAELHDSDTYLDGLATLRFRDGKSATGTDAEEREANRYAASLLMPTAWVRDRFLHMVTGRRPTDEDKAVARLAAEFDVSPQAMRFRLVNLNLIDPA